MKDENNEMVETWVLYADESQSWTELGIKEL